MSNITYFLPKSAYQRMEMQKVVNNHMIDFSKYNATSGDTVEVAEIPAGMMVTRIVLAVHNTEATVTLAVGDEASGTQFLAAQTLTDIKADNDAATKDGAVASVESAVKFYGEAGKKLVLTVGGADADTAIVSVVLEGTIVAKTNYTEEQAS